MPEAFEILASKGALVLKIARGDAARSRVLAFIRQRFQTCFGATVEDDTPTLIGGFDGSGALVAGFGLRDSASGFFCEHYLDAPLETALSNVFDHPVSRREAVEVTHLCATGYGLLAQLSPLLPMALMDRDFRYLTCTATEQLARFFERKGVPSVTLADARIESIPSEMRTAWGRYYASRPRVLAGNLQRANELMTSPRAGV
jgi:Thermostable hemolysin